MIETVYVEIEAEQKVKLSKYVYMDKSDFDEYNRIIDSDMRTFQKDIEINKIAEKYGLSSEEPHDWDDLEDTTFTLVED